MSTGNRKEPGYTGIPLTAENFLSCFCLFKEYELRDTIRLSLNRTGRAELHPPGKWKQLHFPSASLCVTDPLLNCHIACCRSPTQSHWTAEGMLSPTFNGLSVYFWQITMHTEADKVTVSFHHSTQMLQNAPNGYLLSFCRAWQQTLNQVFQSAKQADLLRKNNWVLLRSSPLIH